MLKCWATGVFSLFATFGQEYLHCGHFQWYVRGRLLFNSMNEPDLHQLTAADTSRWSYRYLVTPIFPLILCRFSFFSQAFVDCFDDASGSGFTLDGNRILNWQICTSNKALKLCPRARCNALKRKAQKTGKKLTKIFSNILTERILSVTLFTSRGKLLGGGHTRAKEAS